MNTISCTAPVWLANADAMIADDIREVHCAGTRESWRYWQLLLEEPAKSNWWNGKPFGSWTHVAAIYDEMARRTDDAGRPVYVSEDEQDQAILAARWPGITFHLPPDD